MKMMMEKLGAPQTHVGLKNMIAEIDEDNDGKVSFREVSTACQWSLWDFYKILKDCLKDVEVDEVSYFEQSSLALRRYIPSKSQNVNARAKGNSLFFWFFSFQQDVCAHCISFTQDCKEYQIMLGNLKKICGVVRSVALLLVASSWS